MNRLHFAMGLNVMYKKVVKIDAHFSCNSLWDGMISHSKGSKMCVQETHAIPTFVPSANAMNLDQPMPLFVSLFVQFHNLPANTDDTSSDKLLDLGPDVGVLHVLSQSRRVGLSLLEDGLHDRIGHDTHDLKANMLV